MFAPHWRPDARGLLIGLTHKTKKAHICRAVLEAIAFQNLDVLNAMRADCGDIKSLDVDGGVCNSDILMQMQADVSEVPIRK